MEHAKNRKVKKKKIQDEKMKNNEQLPVQHYKSQKQIIKMIKQDPTIVPRVPKMGLRLVVFLLLFPPLLLLTK